MSDRSVVILSYPRCLESHQADKGIIVHASAKFLLAIAEPIEIFCGEIDSVAACVFSYITQDIGELERHPQVDRIIAGSAIVIAKDLDAHQTDQRGDMVAVIVEFGESVVARPAQIHLNAVDYARQMFL